MILIFRYLLFLQDTKQKTDIFTLNILGCTQFQCTAFLFIISLNMVKKKSSSTKKLEREIFLPKNYYRLKTLR
jgi:hypothetical protein